MMTVHKLKTWPKYFELMRRGEKTFELRKDDRGFNVGDTLVLKEWEPESQEFTGRHIIVRVVYILRDAESFGLSPGHCIMQTKGIRNE